MASLALASGCGNGAQDRNERDQPTGNLFLTTRGGGADAGGVTRLSLTEIDLPSGEMRTISPPEVGVGDPPFFLDRSGDRLVFYGRGGSTYAIDLRLEGPPRSLGESDYFVPSTRSGRVWLVDLDLASPDRPLASVSKVTVDGEVTVRSRTRPPCTGPVQLAVDRFLVCRGDGGLTVFDPATGEVRERLPGVFPLDSHGSVLAWCRGGKCAELRLVDLDSGEERRIAPPGSLEFRNAGEAAFSPDGTTLAVPVYTDQCSGRYQGTPCRIALVDVRNETAELIASPWRKRLVIGPMTWSASSEWLFFLVGRQVLALRPGEERAVPAVALPVRPRARLVYAIAAD